MSWRSSPPNSSAIGPNCWPVIDIDLGRAGYQDSGGTTGTFETTVPFPLRVELDKLL